MGYKALITDVDGTLIVSEKAMPSKKVTEAIIQLQKRQDFHVSIATARPFNQIKTICKELQLSDYAVVSGGAQLVNIKSEKYYYENI
jgi:hydroxymethylpyrimidine pyrophosphatase-like HAD family hydrolase